MKGKKLKINDQGSDDKIIYMSFGVPEKLRNKFKSKVSAEGKKVKDVMANLMEEYLKGK